jgi:glycerophosphoryl diester phosphodiesterase
MVTNLNGRQGNSFCKRHISGVLDRRQFLLGLALTALAWSEPRKGPVKHWLVAHRGGAQLAPENTLAAFKQAIELGSDAYELDIHLTADKDLVVIHDDTLDRTSHKEGVVRQLTLAQLKQADPSLPSLREALQMARGHCKVLVEIKHPGGGPRHEGIEGVLLRQLGEEKMLDQVVVISFDKESLRQLRGKVTTGFLYGGSVDIAAIQQELGVSFVCPHFRLATPALIEQAHDLGMRVNAWTVNEEVDMRRLLEAGCDALTTDRPDRLKLLLGR